MLKQTASKSGATGDSDLGGLLPLTVSITQIDISQTGDFDGNNNNALIGNGNGIFFNPGPQPMSADFKIRACSVLNANIVTFGSRNPTDTVVVGGNRALVRNYDVAPAQSFAMSGQPTGTPRVGEHDGASDIVLIGNGDGVNVQFGGPTFVFGLLPLSAANSSASPGQVGAATGHPTISFKSISINVAGSGNNDGDNNTVLIGNRNGIGYNGAPTASASFIIAGDVGSHDGDNNAVADGNGNGVTVNLLSGALAGPSAGGGTVASGAQPMSSHDLAGAATVWLGAATAGRLLQSPGSAFAGSPFGCLSPTSLTFEMAQISVADSGNNDGNGNLLAIGNEDGFTGGGAAGMCGAQPSGLSIGSDNGNGNVVEIGNANGVNLYLAPSNIKAAGSASTMPSGNGKFIPASITFETIGITVCNSGNNDGNGNTILVGNGNGSSVAAKQVSTAGGGLLIGSEDGNLNTVAIGNGNGVSVYLGSGGGVVIGALSGVASGYWLQDGLGDAFLASTQQEIMRDFASCLPKLSSQPGIALTFESVNIVSSNSGNQDGGGNALAFGVAGGGGGSAVRTGGGVAAGGAVSVGSYDGNNNLVSIGNGNGVNILA